MLATKIPEWQQQWKAEGEAKGKSDIVLRQLRRRFGALPTEVEERVRTASSDQLDDWSERFVDASTLADVFGTDTKH
ncbi:MAG: DUF4351 domain-containing protein [Alphaproteobacteria bacterium]|nr:DUF4351 domain-containing protein [Alphaproteobacteria bacterium]